MIPGTAPQFSFCHSSGLRGTAMFKRLFATFLLLLLSAPLHAGDLPSSSPGSSREITRDSRGRIRRSTSARREFMRETGYDHGRPGYVIDHVVPLACGGADDASNMQWQTVVEAKAKDRW